MPGTFRRVLGFSVALFAGLLPFALPAGDAPVSSLEPPKQPPLEGVAREVVGLTGARTRIVWTRGYRDEGGALMGFDTAEGRVRTLVAAPEVCRDPWFTPDGQRIVYTGPPASRAAYVVDWNGANHRRILEGRFFNVHGVARDAATGTDWVYASDATSREADAALVAAGSAVTSHTGLKVFRCRLDDPSVRELVWDKVPVGVRTTVSHDGTVLVGEFPWPNCGVARLPNDAFTMIAQGCNANLAPDGSGMFFNLIGDHRHIKLYDRSGGQKSQVAVNTMPGNEKDPKRAVWRPRWSNDIRFITVQSADLGPDADISIGRFDEGFTKIEAWARIADTPEYDGNGLAWIEPVIPLAGGNRQAR